MNSLRRKITLGYLAAAGLVVALALLSFMELRSIEHRIASGAHVGEFFDVTLEIRRFEKNIFLYRQPVDFAENAEYVRRAGSLLKAEPELFARLAGQGRIERLQSELSRYAALMAEYSSAGGPQLAGTIRQSGKVIVDMAEDIARTERGALQSLLDQHRQLMIVSVVLVGVLVVVIGQILSRHVGRPLRDLEVRMEAVAEGKRHRLDLDSRDREIVSLTQAFNHVIEELETRQGQLVRSEKLAALGTLLSGVAHELNNPLSNIATSCQILSEELEHGDPAFCRELIGEVLDEAWRARRIVRSLLDYARDRSFSGESLPLAALIEDTLRLIRGRMPVGVDVHIAVDPGLTVWGDRQRLQQVLINLLGNAAEAIAGSGTVDVAAAEVPAQATAAGLTFGKCNGPAIEIVIADDGAGIPADVLPRIFDPFFTTKAIGQGLGLGLFIAFEIIEEHLGSISVASEPGHGTTFRIRLPLRPGDHHG